MLFERFPKSLLRSKQLLLRNDAAHAGGYDLNEGDKYHNHIHVKAMKLIFSTEHCNVTRLAKFAHVAFQ